MEYKGYTILKDKTGEFYVKEFGKQFSVHAEWKAQAMIDSDIADKNGTSKKYPISEKVLNKINKVMEE